MNEIEFLILYILFHFFYSMQRLLEDPKIYRFLSIMKIIKLTKKNVYNIVASDK